MLGLDASIAAQAEYAIQTADAVIFVVDATVGATDTDEAVVKLLRRAGKPVVLCANKVDGQSGEADATALWSLGLGEPYPVSSLHGRGTGDMLDAILEALPDAPEQKFGTALGGPRRIALISHPNIGKSSREQGRGRGPGDRQRAGRHRWRPGRRADQARRHHLEVHRHGRHPQPRPPPGGRGLLRLAPYGRRRGEGRGRRHPDRLQRVRQRPGPADHHHGRGRRARHRRGLQQVGNAREERRYYLEREIETDSRRFLAWAPRVNVSALTGRHMEKLVPAIKTAIEGWETRIQTGRLNAFLGEIVASHPHPIRGGKQPRILFGTQAGTKPPRFVLFASGFLGDGYRRFVERRLREEFGFEGTPIHISVRVREKRGRNKSHQRVRESPGGAHVGAAGALPYATQDSRDPGRNAAGRGRPAWRPTRCQEPSVPVCWLWPLPLPLPLPVPECLSGGAEWPSGAREAKSPAPKAGKRRFSSPLRSPGNARNERRYSEYSAS
ncbi:GTPase Der [Streptomyces microflavus]